MRAGLDATHPAAMLRAVEIVLVRHAESIWNAEHRWQGQTDVPLSERGRAEAGRLGTRLAGVSFDRRICSDLSRTRETAGAIGGEIELDPAWREMDLGAWGGLLHTEVQERHPAELAALIARTDVKIGGGESVPEFERRADDALARVVATSRPSDRVLIVTHGGVIRALVTSVLGMRERRFIGAGNTSVTVLRTGAGGRLALAAYNCSAHEGEHGAAHDGFGGAERARDELLEGPPDEVIRRTVAHLGLASHAAERFCPPPAGTRTHLTAIGGAAALRAFAIPALRDPSAHEPT
jgi:broad specificity phosphatase PhoE